MQHPQPDPHSWPQSFLPPPPPPLPPPADRPWLRHPAVVPALVVAAIVVVGGLGSSSSTPDRQLEPGDVVTDLNTLERGDCIDDSSFDEPEAALSGLITIAICDGPHDLEVSRVHALEAGEDAVYPGESALLEQSLDICERAFDSFVGFDYDESELDLGAYYPSKQTWRKYDDRTIVCTVFDPSHERLDVTLAGAER